MCFSCARLWCALLLTNWHGRSLAGDVIFISAAVSSGVEVTGCHFFGAFQVFHVGTRGLHLLPVVVDLLVTFSTIKPRQYMIILENTRQMTVESAESECFGIQLYPYIMTKTKTWWCVQKSTTWMTILWRSFTDRKWWTSQEFVLQGTTVSLECFIHDTGVLFCSIPQPWWVQRPLNSHSQSFGKDILQGGPLYLVINEVK